MALTLEIDKKDLDETFALLRRTGANMEKATPRIISDLTTLVYRRVREIIADENIYRTGLYSKSVRMAMRGSGENAIGIVGNAARNAATGFPYPVVIEEGSAPHDITPRVKACLHFFAKDGTEVFAKRVHHPGTKPRKVFSRAREWGIGQIAQLVKGFVDKMNRGV